METCLKSDALNVPSEEEVLSSLLRWIHHNLSARQKLLPELMSLTRLHHLPAAALKVETSSTRLTEYLKNAYTVVFFLNLFENTKFREMVLEKKQHFYYVVIQLCKWKSTVFLKIKKINKKTREIGFKFLPHFLKLYIAFY